MIVFIRFMVNDGAYYLSADESPQKGWMIFCARIIGYMWQKGMSEADLIQLKFAECKLERHFPLGSIGKGAEDLTYKSSSLVHNLLLETGSFATFNRVRTMVYGYTSDQWGRMPPCGCPSCHP